MDDERDLSTQESEIRQFTGNEKDVDIRPKTNTDFEIVHRLARFLYWASMLLLLAGMWVMIDPYNRKSGATSHIYYTLGAFELYMWLLLRLARWQMSKRLITDAARSGIFATVLTGLLFIALNELHMASASMAYLISIGTVVLTLAKVGAAKRWLRLSFPTPLLASFCVWVIILAIPAPLIRALLPDKSAQHVVAYFFCWLVALIIAGHIPLIKWQNRNGWKKDKLQIGQWWIYWLLLGIMSVLAILQLYAVMWGMFVEWAQWYFSPIFLAVGVVAVSLSHSCRKRYREAWVVLVLAVLHALIASQDQIPRELSLELMLGGAASYITHPIYSSGVFVTLMFIFDWLLMRRWWMFGLALVIPVIFVMTKAGKAIWTWRHGKGLALLFGAFVLLGLGAACQWWQERCGSARCEATPVPEEDSEKEVKS